MRDKLLFTALGSFALGVLARSFFEIGIAFSLFLFLIAVSILIYGLTTRKLIILAPICLICISLVCISLGIIRLEASIHFPDPRLASTLGERVFIEGIVAEEADERETTTRLVVAPAKYNGESVSSQSRILAILSNYEKFSYGDRVSLSGVLRQPENFESENGRTFDYISYLSKDDIHFEMRYPETRLISSNHGNFLKRSLLKLKTRFVENISKVIPEPAAALASGLIVGAKRSLGDNLLDLFRVVGVIHIVVLSGYNITIVADSVMWFFGKFLARKVALFSGVLSIVAFAIMTGAGATVVRASIMAVLVVIARFAGRKYYIVRALFLAAFIMILHNPKILAFDPSFQLSFLATIGLLLIAPKLERFLSFVTPKWKVRELISATIATQLFVFPFILYSMGTVSLIAPLANLLILPFVPATMLLAFLTGLVGFVSTAASFLFGIAAYLLLSYEILVVETLSKIPFASLQISSFPLWGSLAIYALYVFWWFGKRNVFYRLQNKALR